MKIIGHRGAKGLAPENTLAGIQRSLMCAVDEVEVDARVTRDGTVVLMHDKTLKRLTGNAAVIASHTLAELRVLKPDLATLDEAIDLVNSRVPLRIEVKPNVDTAPIIAMIQKRLTGGTPVDRFVFSSFSFRTLQTLHHELPQVDIEVLERFFGTRATWRARKLSTKRITMKRHVVWFGFILSMKHHGYKLTAYTVNNPAKAAWWQRHGLYGIVTDFPDRFQ